MRHLERSPASTVRRRLREPVAHVSTRAASDYVLVVLDNPDHLSNNTALLPYIDSIPILTTSHLIGEQLHASRTNTSSYSAPTSTVFQVPVFSSAARLTRA